MQRQKSFTRHFFGLWGWLALGAAGVTAVFMALAYFGSRTADRLATEGAETSATVTDKRRTSDSDGGTDYTIRYSFDLGAEVIEDRQDVSLGFYNRVQEGDQIPVRYWTGDPSVSEVEAGEAATTGLIGKIGTALSGIFALIFGRLAWRRASHATWLARHGFRRQVTIADHQETNVTINDTRQWKATWREADGREGATRMARRDNLPEIGSQISILIDPENRRASMWEGDL